MPVRSRRRTTAALDGWVLAVTTVLLWPLLTRAGYPFARDLVLTPRPPLRPESLGLGPGSPRSAPLDAVVALLSSVVDGAVLGRLLVPLGLVLAGFGAHRMLGALGWPARAAIAGLAVWNPWTVERLGLGQWAVIYGYAALFWLVPRLTRMPTGDHSSDGTSGPVSPGRPPTSRRVIPGKPLRVAACAPWLGLGAITPTGAVLAGGVALTLGARGREARRTAALTLLVALVQLPWLVPALLGGAARTSDPSGVQAFAARGEGWGPAWWSLIGLGGIWDSYSVPGSRAGVLGTLTSVVVLVALAVCAGCGGLRRRLPRRLLPVGLASLGLAALSSLPLGSRIVGELTGSVPGFGLLRDAQKWLAAFVLLALAAIAICLDAATRRLRDVASSFTVGASIVAVAAPWLLLPDGTAVVHRVVQPQHYPAGLDEAARVVSRAPAPVLTLPWGLYRRYPWATAYSTYDPASRWFDAPVVTDDSLRVGGSTVQGENPLAAEVGRVLADRSADDRVAGLARLGIRYVAVYSGVAGADADRELLESAPGVARVSDGAGISLFRLPAVAGAGPWGVGPFAVDPWRVRLVAVVDLAVVAVVVGAPLLPRWRRRGASATLA